MSTTDDAQIRRVYERRHDTLMSQDPAGLMALYAEHAVFESPTVLVQFPHRDDGILRGRGEIESCSLATSRTSRPSSANSTAAVSSSPTADFSPGSIRG